MEVFKRTSDYTIYKKRSGGRYAVKDRKKRLVNGEEKTRILLAEGLIRRSEPRPAGSDSEAGSDDAATDAATDSAGNGQPEGGGA